MERPSLSISSRLGSVVEVVENEITWRYMTDRPGAHVGSKAQRATCRVAGLEVLEWRVRIARSPLDCQLRGARFSVLPTSS